MKNVIARVIGVISLCALPAFAQVTPLQVSVYDPTQLAPADWDVIGLRLNLCFGRNAAIWGFDLGVGLNESETMNGIGFALIANSARDMRGIQFGVLNHTGSRITSQSKTNTYGRMYGLQLGVLNIASTMSGIQLGGINIVGAFDNKSPDAGRFYGLQFGVINQADTISGLQIGPVNMSYEITGLQAGLFNIASKLNGIQIGIFNMAANSGVRCIEAVPLIQWVF